jgi:hypothetical protein
VLAIALFVSRSLHQSRRQARVYIFEAAGRDAGHPAYDLIVNQQRQPIAYDDRNLVID